MPDLTIVLPNSTLAQMGPLLLIIGFVMPYIVALVQQRHWSDAWRSRVTFAACGIVAGILLMAAGRFDLTDLASTSIALFALTVTIYKHFAKQNGAAAIEDFSTNLITLSTITAPTVANPANPANAPNKPEAPDAPSAPKTEDFN